MERQAALLLGRLRRYKTHVRPGHSFADGLGIGRMVLLPLDVGLYVSWRHKAHGMPKGLQLTRPMMRGGACFDTNQAGLQLLENAKT
jgi:hypothetical protein